MIVEQPSDDELRLLYETAIIFQSLACWEYMADSDIFGVKNPANDEIGYCCVMGMLGEHYALAVYLGSEGLHGLHRMQQGEFSDDPGGALFTQKCLMASFEDRNMLQKQDLEAIKRLGLKFRGRNAWPQFRSYLPGYAPWFLTRPEVRYLTQCLMQAIDVAPRFKDDPKLLYGALRRGVLVRVADSDGEELHWRDTRQQLPMIRLEPAPKAPFDAERVKRIRATIDPTDGILEAGFFYSHMGIRGENGGRPYYPQIILLVDHRAGYIFNTTLAAPDEVAAKLTDAFMSVIEQLNMLPEEVQVDRDEAYQWLLPITKPLGIRLKKVKHLRAFDSAMQEFLSFM